MKDFTSPKRCNRRDFLKQTAFAGSMTALALQGGWPSLALGQATTAAPTSPSAPVTALGPLVKTKSGSLRGASEAGIRIFRGVPFAESPVGDLRFRPSQPVKPWTGERDATHFGISPMQFGEPRIAHSEDCLQLNIWAPEGKGPNPVFVWIHGGGFTGGHAFEGIYDGGEFAREGIVCVTVAYRLGVFGFMDMSPMLGDAYRGSANNALHDLITALEWVRENIAAFGGDPDHVTIGGESAGAKLTDILMGVPEAQPLFHSMISESGGAERVWPQQNSTRVAQGYGDLWKTQTASGFDAIKTAPAEQLIQTQHDFIANWPQHFPLRCEIDGTLLPKLPVLTIATGTTKGKRLLIGTNREESALFVGPNPSGDATAKDIGNITLEQFLPVYRKYKAIYPEMTIEQLRIRALTAEEYWVPSIRVADAHVAAGGQTWMYRLDFAESSGRLSGYAYHSLDIPLVWDKPHEQITNAAAEAVIAKQMHIAWVAFIKGKAPAAPGLPAWPEYTGTNRETMILNTTSHVEQKPQEAELRLWDHVL